MRLRRIRRYQEALSTRKIEELAPLHPGTDPIALQALAFDALHRESSSFAQLLRYETKFERQYNTAYSETAFLSYLTPPRSAPKPEPVVLPDEPNSAPAPVSGPPRNAPCPCGSGLKYKRCCDKAAPAVLNFPPAAA